MLFGSGEAAATEPAEAAATCHDQSHANPELESGLAADAVADTCEQSKEGSDVEAAAGQTAAPKKKKMKTMEAKMRDKETAVVAGSQANVRKKKKGKKSECVSEKQEGEPVSLLGLNAAEAPWANEPVPDEVAAECVTQSPAQTGMQAKQVHVKTKGKDWPERNKPVKGALSTDQALAVLGFSKTNKVKGRIVS